MLAALHKIIALLLVLVLSSAGLVSADDRCGPDCKHHASVHVKPDCCAHVTSEEEGMKHQKPVSTPCFGNSLCGETKSSHELLVHPSISIDLLPILPIDVLLISYDDNIPQLTNVYLPGPDTSPPIYKLYCSYLH